MQQALMTVSLLDEARQAKVVIPTLMQCAVHGDAALYQAVNGRKEDALKSLGQARATFDPTKDDGPNYLAWSEDLLTHRLDPGAGVEPDHEPQERSPVGDDWGHHAFDTTTMAAVLGLLDAC